MLIYKLRSKVRNVHFKVHKFNIEIHKPVCKQKLWLVHELKKANQMFSLQTNLWTYELQNFKLWNFEKKLANFETKLGTLWQKLCEIDCNNSSFISVFY